MSEADRPVPIDAARKLSEAIREVKNASADRGDVVVELREASRGRLDLLAQELAPVFAEIAADDDRFDLTVSSGMQPRLWIDTTAHVAMGRDRRVYRFVRDTRNGRIVLAESLDARKVADAVTRYIAERMVERERMLEGVPEPFARAEPAGRMRAASPAPRPGTVLAPLGWMVLGALAGAAAMALVFAERLF